MRFDDPHDAPCPMDDGPASDDQRHDFMDDLSPDQLVWLQGVVTAVSPITCTVKDLKRRFVAANGPLSPMMATRLLDRARCIPMRA